MRLAALVIVLAGVTLGGCATKTPQNNITLRLYFVDDDAPSQEHLDATIEAAKGGDNLSLKQIFEWERHTDGEGSLNYSALLLDLQNEIGRKRYIEVFALIPATLRKRIEERLHSAQYMRNFTKNNS